MSTPFMQSMTRGPAEAGVVIIREQARSAWGRRLNRGRNVALSLGQRVRIAAGLTAQRSVFAWQSLFGLNALSRARQGPHRVWEAWPRATGGMRRGFRLRVAIDQVKS